MSGISYLSREQERKALRSLNSTYDSEWSDIGKLKDVRDIPLLSAADILFTARMKNKFSEWRDGLFQEQNQEDQIQGISKDSKFQVTFFEMHPALRLNGFTSHQLKLIQLVMFLHFVSSADMFTFCFLYRYLDCAIYLYPLAHVKFVPSVADYKLKKFSAHQKTLQRSFICQCEQ